MKKKLLIFLMVACSMFTAAGFAACYKKPADSSKPSSSEEPSDEEVGLSWMVTMPNGVQYQNASVVPSISVYEECSIQTTETGVSYVSSDSSVATVSNLGVVRALKAGNVAITVTAGEYTQIINFTVNEAGNVPVIVLENSNVPKNEQGQYECSLFVGGAMNMGAKLKYNGMAYASDVTFAYESDNVGVATVENGVIKAVGEGTTTVRASVKNWRGYTSENLVQTVTVTVKPNVSLAVAEEEIDLYTKTITDEITTFDLAPTAIVNEQADTDAEFTYDYDENVVTVAASGQVTAVGEGETDIVITYTTDGGYEVEKTVCVRVTLPITESNVTFTVDKSGTTLEKTKFGLIEAEEYVRITDEESGESGAIVKNVFTGATLPTGVRTLVVYSNKQGYRIQALVVDKIIKTEADLRALQTTQDVNAYYALGANIQLTQAFDGITTGTFQGTFDGMGYSISGGKVSSGLLGVNTLNATVKNLAMLGVGIATLPPANTNCHGGLLARTMTGTTTVENVYLNMNNPDGWSAAVGVMAYCVKGVLNATNVVSFVTTDRANMASFISWTPDGPTLNTNNVHCGASVNMSLIVTSAPATVNVTKYNAKSEMVAAYAGKTLDVSWASGFSYYTSLTAFLSGN